MGDPTQSTVEASHASDIFIETDYGPASPAKKEFLAWHRPRKHYVRSLQWRKSIQALLTANPRQSGIVKYLGLPGADLLDLRDLHGSICGPLSHRLFFLGFNTASKPAKEGHVEFDVSLDEVRRLRNVLPASNVVWDDYRTMANEASVAWGRAQRSGPFDVINLDLCDGFARGSPGSMDENHYNALNRLFGLQAKATEPWLLFLTTRFEPEAVHADVISKFRSVLSENLRDCPEFKRIALGILGFDSDASLDASLGTHDGHIKAFVVGFFKWVQALSSGVPPSNAFLRSVMGYKVYGGAPGQDLVSIAIEFQPLNSPAADRMGIAGLGTLAIDECAQATGALATIREWVDVDSVLQSDPQLRESIISESAALLVQARYSEAAYRAWAAKQSS